MSADWIYKPIGEVCKTGAGGTPLKSNKDFYEGGKVPWLLSGEVSKKDITEANNFITEKGLNGSSAKVFPRNTVLVAMYGATAGQTGILRIEAATNQAVCGIYPNDNFVPEFLYYTILAKNDELVSQAAGNAQPNISQEKIKNTLVPVLPLIEQQRIVDILDEAFAGIATATANAEKNLQNARELFDSTLQAVFAEKDESWIEHNKPLKDLCELIVDCEHKTAPTQEEGFPSIRTPNIGKGKLLLGGVYRVSEETYREWTRRAEPKPGDLILAREAPAGNVAVIPENLKVCLGQRTVLIRPRPRIFLPEFLAWLLLQPRMQQKLLEHSRGATVQHVNMKDIRALDVGAIPPLPIQDEIISVINEAYEETQRLEYIYQHKMDMLAELKRSILQKAFAGELH